MIGKLKNTVQHYDWGSETAIPSILGEENKGKKPYAELWLGAHPRAPSYIITDKGPVSLIDWIHTNPATVLGNRVAGKFNGKLPFLCKILSAAKPLSIQAHPNKQQAEEGYVREEHDGIPIDAPHRNYKDRNHKPELLCAVTHFDAMCGFRPLDELQREFFQLAEYTELHEVSKALQEPKDTYRHFFSNLMSISGQNLSRLFEKIPDYSKFKQGYRYRWTESLLEAYPNDIGAIAPLYLNIIRLHPGEAIFLQAGVLHAYLLGTGIEIMANSDNVLRGGCTSKHVDVPELLKVLSFDRQEPVLLYGKRSSSYEYYYETPVEEFRLSVINITKTSDRVMIIPRTVEILLCMEGSIRCLANETAGSEQGLMMTQGESICIPAHCNGYQLSGDGRIYRATVPV